MDGEKWAQKTMRRVSKPAGNGAPGTRHEINVYSCKLQASGFQEVDNVIQRINTSKANSDSDLSGGYHYPTFEQLGPREHAAVTDQARKTCGNHV